MKKYLLVYKMEFGNLKQVGLHSIILSLIFFFTLYFFGSVYGQQYGLHQSAESVIMGDTHNTSLLSLEELTHLEGIESYIIFSSIDQFLSVDNDASENDFFIGSLSENYESDNTLEGRTFTSEEQENGKNVIIIPYSYHVLNDIRIGEYMKINEMEYEVIGIAPHMYYESFIVPKRNLFENFGQDHTIEIYIDENLSLDSITRENLVSQIEDHLQSPVIMEENLAEQGLTEIIRQAKILSIILFSLAIINILYIYSYILGMRKKLINIYRLNGATIGFIIRSLVIGLLIIYTICFGISYALLNVFQKIFSQSILGSQPFMLTLYDLISFFFIMLIIYLLPLFVYMRKWIKNSIVFSLKGGS